MSFLEAGLYLNTEVINALWLFVIFMTICDLYLVFVFEAELFSLAELSFSIVAMLYIQWETEFLFSMQMIVNLML